MKKYNFGNLREELFKDTIKGRNIYISRMNCSIKTLFHFFKNEEIYMFLGFDGDDDETLRKFEHSLNSILLIAQMNRTNELIGFGQLVVLNESQEIVEIHGCGLNSTFYQKIMLTETWFLLISLCIDELKCTEIRTTCLLHNLKGYNFITNTGFCEIERNDKLIFFRLNYAAFSSLKMRLWNN